VGKVSHEKTRTATRSVKHACSIAMCVFLLPIRINIKHLDKKLQERASEVGERVRCEVVEPIELADWDLLDISRPRRVEKEVLDLIDESNSR
jgi:hypothetical protein